MTMASPSLIPAPEPLPLPAPLSLLWTLLLVTFVLHVLAMNLLAGGAIVAAHARLRHAANVHARAVVALFARLSPVLMTATVTLGVAPLLFLQVMYGRVFFVSSILMAWLWLAVVPGLIVAYLATYKLAFTATARGTTPVWPHLVVAGLVLGIGFLYTSNMSLMLRADRFGEVFRASATGLHVNLGDPTLWPRWVHMMLGAVGVAGLAIAIVGVTRSASQPAFAAWATCYGASWSALATGANLIVGVAWLIALPAPIRRAFLAPTAAGAAMAVGVAGALATSVLLVRLARRPPSAPLAVAAAGTMLVTVIGMALARDAVRTLTLKRLGFVEMPWVVAQWVPIALFVVLLLVAIATVAWMVYELGRAQLEQSTTEHGAGLRTAS